MINAYNQDVYCLLNVPEMENLIQTAASRICTRRQIMLITCRVDYDLHKEGKLLTPRVVKDDYRLPDNCYPRHKLE